MFSGCRGCLRIKVNYRLLPRDQPFHILYPRLFAAQQQHSSIDQPAYASPTSTENSFIYTLSELRGKANTEIVPPFHKHHVHQEPSENPPEALANVGPSTECSKKSNAEGNLRAILDRRRARQGVVLREQHPHSLHLRTYFAAPGSTSGTVSRSRWGRDHTYISFERSRWERTLIMLADASSEPAETEGEELWLSKLTLIVMSGTSGANSWVHNVLGGCEVQVAEAQCPSGRSRKVFLRGSPRAMVLTREYLEDLEKDVRERDKPRIRSTTQPDKIATSKDFLGCESTPVSGSNLPVRLVFPMDKRHLQRADWMRADQIPPPAVYDVRSFLHYVEHLTTTRVPRLVRREIYGLQGDTHNKVVAMILCRLFADTDTARFASTAALNLAFAFLCQHTELFDQTSQLYDQSRHLRLTLQPQTYGYVLRVMFFQDEMQRFRRVLDDLLSEGHRPDSKIWLTLLESGPTLRQKYTIAEWMFRKGLLGDPKVKGQVAADMFSAELRTMKSDRTHTGLLLTSIDARFGLDWMSERSVAQALKACADNKAWTLAVELFKEAQRRGLALGIAAISAVFTVMQRQGSLRDALDLLCSHYVQTTGRNDDFLIPLIFMTAWRHRFYNVCRVLWRYAATLGAITYKMQNVVTTSLLRNQDICSASAIKGGLTIATAEWRRRAGKVIVGTDLDNRGFQGFFNKLHRNSDSTSTNPMVLLAQYTSDSGPRDQQSSLAYVMLYRDLEAWKHFAPPSSERLFLILRDAYAMDVQWKSEGIGLERGGKSTKWMVENAIAVPLVKREIFSQAGPRLQDGKTHMKEE